MDIRENIDDFEEVIRACVTGEMKKYWTAMPCAVTQDTQDGHVSQIQPLIQRAVTNADGSVTYEDHVEHPDVPIHHMGGGGVSVTHPNKQGDTGAVIYASRAIDTWFQNEGSQQPIDDRMHHLGDGFFLSGIRSIPRRLQQVSKDSSQLRSDDKKNVIDHHPTNGTTLKAVDPSTQAASQSFDPFTQATKFFDHVINPTSGHKSTATDGGTVHSHSLDHDSGFTASAQNGAHTATVHPTNGVGITSTVAHTITAPNASLDTAGNLQNSGNHQVGQSLTAAQSVTAGQSMSAPSGNFASGSIGGVAFGGANSILSMAQGALQIGAQIAAGGGISAAGDVSTDADVSATGNMSAGGKVSATGAVTGATLEGGTVQTTLAYTVATLPAPTMALQGTRAFVTDATAASFMVALVGGGAKVCPAFCDGTAWLCA